MISKCSIITGLLLATACVEAIAQQPKPSVVMFSAEWCQYCRAIKPAVANIQLDGFDIRIVDVDDPAVPGTNMSGKQLSALYRADTIPAFYIVTPQPDTGPKIARYTGKLTEMGLRRWLYDNNIERMPEEVSALPAAPKAPAKPK